MASKTNAGGTFAHKNPDCRCNPCKARRRQAEAVAGAAGTRGAPVAPPVTTPTTLAQISADMPLVMGADQNVDHRARIVQWMTLKAEESGISNMEIARRMGIPRQHLQALLSRAVREGWLKFDDPLSRLEHEIVPKAIDNLVVLLNDQDKVATMETLKGTAFPAYRESKGISDAPQTVLALKIEAPEPSETKVLVGTVVGKPKVFSSNVP